MYKIETTFSGEKSATVEDFIHQVNEVNVALNESWNTVKESLPADQRAAAEQKVRQVLKA